MSATGWPANVTKSNRSDMASLTFHGIGTLPIATGRECHPCLRTDVTYVSGLYSLLRPTVTWGW